MCPPLVSWAQSRHLSASRRLEGVCGQLTSPLESGRTASDQSPVGPERSSSTPTPKPTVHKSGPSLKMFLLILLFLGLADACIPREGKPSSSCHLPLLCFFLPRAGAWWLASENFLGSKSRLLPAPCLEILNSPFLGGDGGVGEVSWLLPLETHRLVSEPWLNHGLLRWCGSKKNPSAKAGDARNSGSNPGSRRLPWRRKWQPTLVFLPGKSHGQRSLAGYSPWGRLIAQMLNL